MMKQARTLLSRSLCAQSNSLFEGNFRASTLRGFASVAGSGFSSNKDAAQPGGKLLVHYAIFKGKGALCVEPVLPTFIKTESGNLRMDRKGCVMMTFMPSAGVRKYDWEKKQLFALSPTEVGAIISMGSKDTSEFFHDPGMKSSTAGQVRKSMSIKPHADGSGYFISLSVNNSILNKNDWLVVPVTIAEFTVLKTSFTYALPHILGWARLISQEAPAPPMINSQPKFALPKLEEWDN